MNDKPSAVKGQPDLSSLQPLDPRSVRLGDLLVARGHIDASQLMNALTRQGKESSYLGDLLLADRAIDQSVLYQTLAEQAGLPFVPLESRFQDPAVAGILPFFLIQKLRAIPLFKVENALTVAMDDPTNLDRTQELAFATKCKIHAVFTTAEAIDSAIMARSGNLLEIEGVEEGPLGLVGSETSDEEAYGWKQRDLDKPSERGSLVVDLIDSMIIDALTTRASDIHLEPKARHLRVRFRVDGILEERPSIPAGLKAAVISRCKIMSRMDIAERRTPQDGAFSMKYQGRRIDFRASTFPTRYGEVIVIRILDRSSLQLDLVSLGFPSSLAGAIRQVVVRPNGILLVTGPTGSGKTSTLYALLKELDATHKNIITLEDPIEYDLDDVCQGQTNNKAGFTFAKGLRSILRQDPDVIMVGEIRDVETAQTAIQAALTGHLVMSSLHTNSAASAVARLLDMGLEPFLLATSISGILAQRLVRRLCANCRQPYQHTEAEAKALGIQFPSGATRPMLFRARGCPYCNGLGYRGRAGIFEYISVEQKVQSMIIRRISGRELERELEREGEFATLRLDGLAKVEQGITTLEEVLRVTSTQA